MNIKFHLSSEIKGLGFMTSRMENQYPQRV